MYFRSVMFLAIGEFSGLFPGQNWPECENGFAEGSLGPIGGKASRDPPAGRPWSRLLRCRSGNIRFWAFRPPKTDLKSGKKPCGANLQVLHNAGL